MGSRGRHGLAVAIAAVAASLAALAPGAGSAGTAASQDAARADATARAAAPQAWLYWKELFGDFVSASETTRPDGANDGHFVLTIDPHGAPGLTVTAVELRSTDPTGKSDGSQVWDTVPGNGMWALGVGWKGTYLNAGTKALKGAIKGRTAFDLYAASSGYFLDGNAFKVLVTLSNGTKLRALAKITPPVTELTARYNGTIADMVGTGATTGADGAKDLDFELKLTVHGRRVVTDIRVDSADAKGVPDLVAYWNTIPDGAWIAAVYNGGRRLNPTDKQLSWEIDSVRTISVFCAINPGSTPLAPGTKYVVTVTFLDGKVSAVTSL